jgi:hypothetical protein
MLSTPLRGLLLAGATVAGIALASHVAAARRIASTQRPVVVAEEPTYTLELIGEDGSPLQTFRRGRRMYVLGDHGDRYSIRVTNPTPQRIEAVVSVDGLDVIDGDPASVSKRGYVVMPFDTLQIDGFRVSTAEVAAFRFSSVADSYAGRKGKARHVGVIGLAVFEEKAQPSIAMEPADGNRVGRGERERRDRRSPAPSRSAEPASDPGASPEATLDGTTDRSAKRERPGLGTEFGEHRSSVVNFTRFERANPRRPQARAELRYNDAGGLRALGIRVEPVVDVAELELREGADPFPTDDRFAQPPR